MSDELNTGATPAPAPTGEQGAPAVTENSATPAAGEPANNPANPAAEPKPKKEHWVQKRINELTRDKGELQRQNERILSLLERQQQGQPKEDEPPKPEKYGTLDEYMRATVAYELKQANKPEKQETRGKQSNGPDPDFAASVDDLKAEGLDKYDDFEEKMDAAQHITPPMANAILESEDRVEVSMYLFNNQAEARRISKLSPLSQIREIGKIEAKLASAPPTKKPSNAPAPPAPVGGTGSADTNVIKPEMDFKDFLKVRNKQLGRK